MSEHIHFDLELLQTNKQYAQNQLKKWHRLKKTYYCFNIPLIVLGVILLYFSLISAFNIAGIAISIIIIFLSLFLHITVNNIIKSYEFEYNQFAENIAKHESSLRTPKET